MAIAQSTDVEQAIVAAALDYYGDLRRLSPARAHRDGWKIVNVLWDRVVQPL